MNGPKQPPYVARSVRLDARTVRWLRLLLLAAAATVFGLLYLLFEDFRSETNRALGVLGLDALPVRARARGGRVLRDLTRPRQGPRGGARREDGARVCRPLVRAVGGLRRFRRTSPAGRGL